MIASAGIGVIANPGIDGHRARGALVKVCCVVAYLRSCVVAAARWYRPSVWHPHVALSESVVAIVATVFVVGVVQCLVCCGV